ncbi:unnamed protein product, partial [Protopolystoma xenopodis]
MPLEIGSLASRPSLGLRDQSTRFAVPSILSRHRNDVPVVSTLCLSLRAPLLPFPSSCRLYKIRLVEKP